MKIATGVLTAPRPGPSTIERTCESLRRAGFAVGSIYADVLLRGQYSGWIELLRMVIDAEPLADAYFLVEDDMIFWRGLRGYCEQTLFPDCAGICSPYRPEYYPPEARGWNLVSNPHGLASGSSWILPREIAFAILADEKRVGQLGNLDQADARVSQWLRDNWLLPYFHTPSLGQHLWGASSLIRGPIDPVLVLANDFIGEDADSF